MPIKFKIKWFFYFLYWHIWYWKCIIFDHNWEELGGRSCPKYIVGCYQTVYKCYRCGEEDYGDKEGPGWKQCYVDCNL